MPLLEIKYVVELIEEDTFCMLLHDCGHFEEACCGTFLQASHTGTRYGRVVQVWKTLDRNYVRSSYLVPYTSRVGN